MANQVRLVMEYHPKTGQWLIQTPAGGKGSLVQFPSERRVEQLWNEYSLNKVGIHVLNSLVEKRHDFWIKTQGRSTQAQRKKFLSALGAESKVAEIEVRSVCVCTFNNELGDYIARALTQGFELLTTPVFSHLGPPPGWNPASVGSKHPHFLVIIIKRP